jgi:cobalt-zinc-cadmium efflux system outer membrane protein
VTVAARMRRGIAMLWIMSKTSIYLAALFMAVRAATLSAQQPTGADSVVAIALRNNPSFAAASQRAAAAHARVSAAGALPDPMLMAGIDNVPLGSEAGMAADLPDPMTMRTIALTQTVPYPGKLAMRTRVARSESAVADARAETARNQLTRDVKRAYYELAYVNSALSIVHETQTLLLNTQRAAEASYVAGTGEQRAILDTRVEATRLTSEAAALEAERRSQIAQLTELMGGAQLSDSAVLPVLNTRALPSLPELQDHAVRENPELRALAAEQTSRAAEAVLARKDVLPDFDLSLRYGQRAGRPDMLSASVSVPLPVFKARKQDNLVHAAQAEQSAAEMDLQAARNRVRADVAMRLSDLERTRTQLALFANSILPDARAAVESATASFQAGRSELLSVLQRRQQLLSYQTEYQRLLADYASGIAELDLLVGGEVLK